jgi:hypothetical protein
MNYYLYISDAKVEMLFNQLDAASDGQYQTVLRGGFGKWIGIERTVEVPRRRDESLEKRLASVVSRIRAVQEVGTLEDIEHDWIEDTFPCYLSFPVPSVTGSPVMLLHHQDPPDVKPRLAFRQVLLVGSAAYMMPRARSDEAALTPLPPGGPWHFLSHTMTRILDGEEEEDLLAMCALESIGPTDGPYATFKGTGPIVKVRSMFRVLHQQDIRPTRNPGKHFVYLGTPLYVQWQRGQPPNMAMKLTGRRSEVRIGPGRRPAGPGLSRGRPPEHAW